MPEESSITTARLPIIGPMPPSHYWLWILALLTWGVGDLATTIVAIETGAGYETVALWAILFAELGPLGYVANAIGKLLILGAIGAVYRRFPAFGGLDRNPFRAALPATVAAVGLWLTVTNAQVILGGAGGR